MENSGARVIPKVDVAEGSATTIEIKIKTLDSQTYTLKVNKQMPVPALKEQIASVTGVLSDQQRLICRGKVLKDDQLLSAYHVEDGHTLHLVVRQPISPSSEGGSSAANDSSSAHRGSAGHISPSVVIEAFSVPDQGEGVPREISRIVSAVLGSFGLSSFGSSTDGRSDRASGATNVSNSNQPASEQSGSRGGPSDRWPNAFGLPAAVSLGQPPVMPDSLVTMSQYLNHMRRDFIEIGRGSENQAEAAPAMDGAEGREPNSAQNPAAARGGLPTPASLAEIMLSTRQMLIEEVANSLQTFASELENQTNVADPSMRSRAQDRAMRIGMSILYLGAYMLELGRTVMTLRLGQNPSEAVVNAGPAIYISPSGPNPLMVQPLPFQMGPSFSGIPIPAAHPGSSFGGGLGTGFLPRRIDIQIRRGTPNATANANREDQQQPPSVQATPNVRVQATTVPTQGGGNENATSAAGEAQNNQEQGRQIPASVYQILRSLFPGGEILVEEESGPGTGTGTATGFASQTVEMSAAMDAASPQGDAGASSDGVFLSNLLHQIMPLISQHSGSDGEGRDQDPSSLQAGSSGVGATTSCSEDPNCIPPDSKRQKRE